MRPRYSGAYDGYNNNKYAPENLIYHVVNHGSQWVNIYAKVPNILDKQLPLRLVNTYSMSPDI